MGVETALAIGAGSQLLGSGLQYGENRAARKRAQQVSNQAQDLTAQPLGSDSLIQSKLNSGQDSYLQMLRSDPTALQPFMFNYSQAFKDLSANDNQQLQDQLNAQSAGAGSLGARYGSGFAASSALLRARNLASIQARNAGIAQNSFNTALNTGLQDFTGQQGRTLSLLQMLQSGQLQQRQQQLGALGINVPGTGAGQLVSNTGNDLSTLLLLSGYLKGGSSGAKTVVPTPSATNYNPVFTG